MVPQDRISHVIFEYAAKIGAAQDLDALLLLNAGMARALVGADRCSIWLVDAKNSRLWTKVAHGVEELNIDCPVRQKDLHEPVVDNGLRVNLRRSKNHGVIDPGAVRLRDRDLRQSKQKEPGKKTAFHKR